LQVVTASGGPVAFSCRVGGAVLGTVEGFIGSEQISSNYCYRVAILSESPELNGDDYVGQDAVLVFQRHGLMTFFDGMVSRFGLVGFTGHVARYVLEIVPHLSVLRYTTDYGIYQDLSTPDIVKQVIRDVGLPGPDTSSLRGGYDRREYVVQYGETSLDFISRLMENEGIFYYFQHNDGVETLRLADPDGALAAFAEYAYHGDNAGPDTPAEEYVKTFGRQSAMFTGRATVRDHDFKQPDSEIMGSFSDASGIGERYEFGQSITAADEAERIARARLERLQLERRTLAGSGNGGDMKAGGVFLLADGSGAGLGGEYVVTGVRHGGLRVASGTNVTFYYGNQFTAIPSVLPFRPAVRTPKPRATGPSSAVVVGLSGQDPYVDKYGRVKVRFDWGRKGHSSGNTSVWIRVAQPYAGKSYGMTFLPGVGHEVVVDFLDGDPDRPIIVGSVHNGANMPPYTLPARNATSTIKTRSNEIRFDDTVGSEELYVKGGRDLNVEVANDTTFDGGHDVTVGVANDVVVNGGRDMTVSSSRRLSLNSTNEINLNAPKTTISGDFVLSSVAPTSTSARVDYQVGELTRKTAPIALMVAGVSGTTLTTLCAYNCTAARLEQGIYEITFRDPPANAYYAAAITPTAGIGVPLFANIIEKVRGSFIFAIADPGGTPVDKPFSVVVFGGF
jgi:type VI secretion system secreted protein VgrG